MNPDNYRANEYDAGKRLAHVYLTMLLHDKVTMFKAIAKESDYCILGFMETISGD